MAFSRDVAAFVEDQQSERRTSVVRAMQSSEDASDDMSGQPGDVAYEMESASVEEGSSRRSPVRLGDRVKGIASGLGIIGFLGLGLLFMYAELITFTQMGLAALLPAAQLVSLVNFLSMPVTWILWLFSVVCAVAGRNT
jgi:hypothetical protein